MVKKFTRSHTAKYGLQREVAYEIDHNNLTPEEALAEQDILQYKPKNSQKMATKKVDIHELTKKFNEFRQANQGRTFSTKELYAEFNAMGFNSGIAQQLTKFLDAEKIGTSKLFTFKDTPLLEVQIENLYRKARKASAKSYRKSIGVGPETISEKIAIEVLQKAGNYRIKKAVGFDVERFRQEHPDLYRKYTIYEYM